MATARFQAWFALCSVGARRPLKLLSHRSLADVKPEWNGYPIPYTEEGTDNPVLSTVPTVSYLIRGLQEAKHPDSYSQAIATMAYTAQRAKFAVGAERQQWTDLFIESFRTVYVDILGDPNQALGLC